MKYAIRAVKYFFYFVILLAIIMTVLVLLGVLEPDIEGMFRKGYDSLWQIALMFAAVSAFYPYFGFVKKDVFIPGEYGEIRPRLISFMEERGYVLEKEEGGNLFFRMRSFAGRLSRMYEDRISFFSQEGGFKAEGLRKDLVRIVYRLEYLFRADQE